jgi:thymidylate synthase (FAD)
MFNNILSIFFKETIDCINVHSKLVCYKSEDKIEPGSAEKLLTKVVREYEHLSVVEHLGMIVKVECLTSKDANDFLVQLLELQPLFRFTIASSVIILSGNIRMWVEFFRQIKKWRTHEAAALLFAFNARYPFFAAEFLLNLEGKKYPVSKTKITLLDENPLTNKSNLSISDMKKHMTLTCRIICDRATSHQLVRHRLMSYSQESMRFCNYGKKGAQYIIPDEVKVLPEELQFAFEEHTKCGYKLYEGLMREGKLAPEMARRLLGHQSKTEVITTGTLEMWQHIFKHRGHNNKAERPIRELTLQIEKVYRELLPAVFNEV